MKASLIKMESDASEKEVINVIKNLNEDDKFTGIILQSPVPNHINIENCIKYIDSSKDIDGFTKESLHALFHNEEGLRPCTARGIIKLLEYYNINISGANVCIIGRGNIVGKPLVFEMLNKDATVAICHSKTKNLKEITKEADIVVSAVGKAGLLTKDMVKKDAIVIDVGMSMVNGKLKGDVDYENVAPHVAAITPTPGGIGPMTIAVILENLVLAHKMKEGKKWIRKL